MLPVSAKPFSHLLFTVAFIFYLTLLPPKPVMGMGSPSSASSERSSDEKHGDERRVLLGSSPPRCVNKCLNCRPCRATLVIPSHQNQRLDQTSSRREDDSYYLLSWKCACGKRLFHP